jgi:hypothetical protein
LPSVTDDNAPMRRALALLAVLVLAGSCNPSSAPPTAGVAVSGKVGGAPSAAPQDEGVTAAQPAPAQGTDGWTGRASRRLASSSGPEAAAETTAPEPLGASALAPVETLLPELRLDAPPGQRLHGDAVAAALGTPGVRFATALSFAEVAVTLPDGRSGRLRMAGIDPAGFRILAPQITADEPAVWERLAEGHLAVSHGLAEHLRLGLDDALDAPGGPLQVKVVAALGQPPAAEAVVDLLTGQRLGLGPPSSLLVAVEPDAWPDEVAADLERNLGMDATLLYGKPQRRWEGLPDTTVWDRLAVCEASGDWGANTGNGYYGGLQFLPSSWQLVGGTGLPHEASRDEQIYRAELLLQRQGWRAWPVCSVRLGLRQPEPDEHPDGRPKRPPPAPAPVDG